MPHKTAILDASSAIILYKSGLHSLLVEMYNIALPQSVYHELTANQYTGADEFKKLARVGKIYVHEPSSRLEKKRMAALDTGESDTIQMYFEGEGEFVITDDGQAAKFCKREGIPFINALLFPRVLQFAGRNKDDFCRRAMERIIENGRYSAEVITFARECRSEHISFAVP